MIQYLIIAVFFLTALAFLGWRGWKAVARRDSGCAKGCGCPADKIVS